jgi:hypothetical protein
MVMEYGLTEAQDVLLETIRDWKIDGGLAVAGVELQVARALEEKGLVKVTVVGQMWKKGWYYRAHVTEKGSLP